MVVSSTRVGIVGATPGRGWGSTVHLPALQALPGFDVTAVCSQRPESAKTVAKAARVPKFFSNSAALARCDDVDVVAVCVKVPAHFRLVMEAFDAGKAVYCEWPLGRNLAEAEALQARAKATGLRNIVGLQARMSPVINYVRDLVRQDYVGRVLSTTLMASIGRDGNLMDSANAYTAIRGNGANTLTISAGHSIDAMNYRLGNFRSLSATLATQWDHLRIADTGAVIAKDSPDQIAVTGILDNGAVATVHIQSGVHNATRFLFEMNGTEGDLRVVSDGLYGLQMSELILEGNRHGTSGLTPLPIPDRYSWVSGNVPSGPAFNVAQLYERAFHDTGEGEIPDFDAAVRLHRTIAAIEIAAATGNTQVSNHLS